MKQKSCEDPAPLEVPQEAGLPGDVELAFNSWINNGDRSAAKPRPMLAYPPQDTVSTMTASPLFDTACEETGQQKLTAAGK